MNLALLLLIAVGSRESALPVAGQWRGSSTSVVLTNTAARPARVTISWIVGSPRDFAPPHVELMLHGGETRVVDVGQEVLRGMEAAGALKIVADADVVAQAIVRGRPEGAAASFEAVPLRDAIGTGESTTIAATGENYRLFVAETKGHPIYFSLRIGEREQRHYVEPLHQLTVPIKGPTPAYTLELRGINGSGKLVAAGAQITPEQDLIPFGMRLPSRPRHQLGSTEVTVYGVLALALVILGWRVSRSRTSQ